MLIHKLLLIEDNRLVGQCLQLATSALFSWLCGFNSANSSAHKKRQLQHFVRSTVCKIPGKKKNPCYQIHFNVSKTWERFNRRNRNSDTPEFFSQTNFGFFLTLFGTSLTMNFMDFIEKRWLINNKLIHNTLLLNYSYCRKFYKRRIHEIKQTLKKQTYKLYSRQRTELA